MPLGNFFCRKEKSAVMSEKEQRSKLGMKVVMAQQNPEPVYDLADCGMVELPPDTFVMCRLLQKTSLLLRHNALSSLEKGGKLNDLDGLEILDLGHNKFHNLSDGICKLKNLRILNLNKNKIKSLPSSLNELSKLQELHLSHNKLSKVPTCVCALPNLRILSLNGNNITVLPKEFSDLQGSLVKLEVDADAFKFPSPEIMSEGVEAIMRYLCEERKIEYVGLKEPAEEECSAPSTPSYREIEQPEDESMRTFMRRKEEMLKAHLAAEEEFQAKEQEQLAHILRDASSNKKHLLEELSHTPAEAMDYERKKLLMLQEQYNIEENLRLEQADQLEKYLAMSSDKEALISTLSAQQAELDSEVEGIVTAREKEHDRLLKDLETMEQETAAAVEELVSAASSRRSAEFVCLLEDQEKEIQSLMSGIAEAATELRRSEVIAAMQAALVEEAEAEKRQLMLQQEQGVRVIALLEENDLVNSHLEGVITTRVTNQEAWVSTLQEDEECQATAFKLLLLKTDLERNNILRQIGQVEYELARLSSLELRKKRHGIRYGSNTMLDQRVTLAGLLKSLLLEKTEREAKLTAWLNQLQGARSSDIDENEFWLVQYQRLLSIKPAGLAEAEEKLDPRVREVLLAAKAADLIPLFAREEVTFDRLLDLDEDAASALGIGIATYHSLQRALQSHLSASKLKDQTPSAPLEEDLPHAPSAPPPEPSGPELEEEGASAPPLDEQFVEAECVVCLSSECQVIFLPCGHVCVCAQCCTSLAICPLCRAPVISKILLNC